MLLRNMVDVKSGSVVTVFLAMVFKKHLSTAFILSN